MSVENLHDKFVHHLEELYYVENRLVEVLDGMAADVTDEALAEGIERHREQTRDHVNRLEQVFEAIDEPSQQRELPTFDALLEEREALLDDAAGDEDMMNLCDHGVAVKNEHLEIAGYESLIMLARKLDYPREVRNLLEANLDDERETKKQLKSMGEDSTARKLLARLAG